MSWVSAFTTGHRNGDHFAIVYDENSGHKGRYTVFVWRVGKTAKIIGRELDLKFAKQIVKFYPKKPWLRPLSEDDELTTITKEIHRRGKAQARRH